jgi:hypothetical protein
MADRKDELRSVKAGAEALATCIVKTLNESDQSFQTRFLERLDHAYAALRDKEGQDCVEMLSWTREMLTGWNPSTGQGSPLLDR